MPDKLFEEPDLAAVYDLFAPPADRQDFAFYLPLIMQANSVLDLGCGTGALLHMARASGHKGRLCGIDPATGMIEQARKQASAPAIEWVHGDITSEHWTKQFDLVVMTGHAFQVLLTDDELRTTLSLIRDALQPGGNFAFETRNPVVRGWRTWNEEYSDELTDQSGNLVRAEHVTQNSENSDFVSFTTTFYSPRWPEPKVSHSTLRFLSQAEITAFLEEASLEIEEQYGNWDRSEVTDESPEIITIARRRDR